MLASLSMKHALFFMLIILLLFGCSKKSSETAVTATPSATPTATPTATPEVDTPKIKLTATMTGAALRLRDLPKRVNDTMLTPSIYKMALVNFWLIKDDNSEINLINPDENNPTYTEDRPLIVDFSADGDSRELISLENLSAGTYTGWKMQMLYMEMKLPTSFHVPSDAFVTDNTDFPDYLDTQLEKSFRLYFNAIGKYWKRDFVVELEENSGNWYWMRRAVNDSDSHRNFFIDVSGNDHPPGGPGFESTIDLFADLEFWGEEADYSVGTTPIIVGTHSTAGGVNAVMNESFTIPETLTAFTNIDLQVDITGTMLFNETGTAPTNVTFIQSVLDLGPGYLTDLYGDQGLHPFVPQLSVSVTTGEEDAFADAKQGFQIPQECATNEWIEPATCYEQYCTDEMSETDFCVLYAESIQ